MDFLSLDMFRKKYISDEEWKRLDKEQLKKYETEYGNYLNAPDGIKFLFLPSFMQRNEKEDKTEDEDFIVQENLKIEVQKKNPKRSSRAKINYAEASIPPVDSYIFCDTCQMAYVDCCPRCGMLRYILDVPVPKGTQDRARKTAPPFLRIGHSSIDRMGVFAKEKVPSLVQMGPYEGTLTKKPTQSGYSWKIGDNMLMDASNETNSNWMRYVNCARHSKEQNLVAFQYEGEIYYRTCRIIEEGEELLVFYGNEFAAELGINTQKYFDPRHEVAVDKTLVCPFCFNCLTTLDFLKIHEKYCRRRPAMTRVVPEEDNRCQYCQLNFTTKKSLDEHVCRARINLEKKEEKNMFCCKDCDYKTKYKSNLKSHEDYVHKGIKRAKPTKSHACPKCDYVTNWKQALKTHQRIHSNVGLVKCEYCVYMANENAQYFEHLLRKHPEKNVEKIITGKMHVCQTCGFKSVLKGNFSEHLLKHSKVNARTFSCHDCDYIAYYKNNLVTHTRTHTKMLPFKCSFCKKTFNQKYGLGNHLLLNHSKENIEAMISNKIYECQICFNYKTLNSTHFKGHLKTHLK